MADKKISALTGATTPLDGTEVLPIVQSSATVKVATNDLTVRNIRANATTGILQVTGPTAATTRVMTVPDANFTAARTDAAQSFTGDQTLSTGNLVIGTSGKGIDFSATPGTGTSELLADYEEGTWTPAPFFSTSNTYTAGSVYGSYTKVGRLVSVTFLLSFEKNTATGNFTITGLPFTSLNSAGNRGALAVSYLQRIGQADKIVTGFVAENTTTIQLYFTGQTSASTIVNITDSDIDSNTASVVGTITYQV